MSGFEIIGLILGAMPVLISALEGYQKLGKKRDAFKRKSLHIDRMIRALDWQQKLICSDVKIVLRNAGMLDDDEEEEEEEGEIEGIMLGVGDGDGKLGRKQQGQQQGQHGMGRYQDLLMRDDVQRAVKAFLRDNSSSYLEVIQQCEDAIFRIAKAVKGFDDGSWVANGSLRGLVNANQQIDKPGSDFLKRVKFSMHKDELENSIKEIDNLSRLLERLREKSHQEHQIMIQSSSASSKGAVSMLRKVQTRALKLYRALAQSWTQSCQDPHEARLYLDYRADDFGARKRSFTSNKVEFSVTLQSCTNPSYQSCVVEALDFDDSEHNKNDRKSAISFRATSDAVAKTKRLNVDNMCHILDRSMSTNQPLRLYLVENERLYYEHVSPGISGDRFTHVHEKMVSLQDLLQDPAYRRLLQLKPRVKLAAIMASSALQLHATPWCKKLRNESLLFIQDVSGKINLGHPFVACNFNSNQSSLPADVSSSQAESKLLDLGILILELWHHETMETFARDMGLQLDDIFDTRQSVARKWITETKDDLLTSIYDAAVRCINCRFDAVDLDLTNHKLNVSIFDGVVKPLWENCKS